MKRLNHIDTDAFIRFFKIDGEEPATDYLSYFSGFIERIEDFAIAPFCWAVSNHYTLRLEHVSHNIDEFTAYSKEEWLTRDAAYFSELYHPDDRAFIRSAIHFMTDIYLGEGELAREGIRFSIYVRMISRNNIYRWVLMQFAQQFISLAKNLESVLFVVYDMDGLQDRDVPLLSMVDHTNGKSTHYIYEEQQIKQQHTSPVILTRREKEVLALIFKGFTTPQIAEKLFISYHTVENHKRNLRQKTNTKTTGELVAYTIKHLGAELGS